MKYFYSMTFIVLISFVNSQQLSDDYDTFLISFPRIFSKDSAEYQTRNNIFKQNVKFYNSINNNPKSTYKVKISNNSDNTKAQIKVQRGIKSIGNNLRNTVHSAKTRSFSVGDIEPPASVNYKTQNKVTQVRDQGMCGSCWAFAAVTYYESQLMIRGFRYNLSQQASLQCTWRYAPNNQKNDCGEGGYLDDAFGYLAKVGSVLRNKYPYIAQTTLVDFPNTPGICTETERIFIGKGVVDGHYGLTISQVKYLLANHGPLMVGISSSSEGFLNYASGIYSGCSLEDQLDHAVLLIGYDGNKNWIIKNSWGTSWGQNGFIRISMTNDCKITQQVYRLVFLQPQLENPSATFNPITMMNMLSSDLAESIHLLTLALMLFLVIIQ